jgi:hypothetical protein
MATSTFTSDDVIAIRMHAWPRLSPRELGEGVAPWPVALRHHLVEVSLVDCLTTVGGRLGRLQDVAEHRHGASGEPAHLAPQRVRMKERLRTARRHAVAAGRAAGDGAGQGCRAAGAWRSVSLWNSTGRDHYDARQYGIDLAKGLQATESGMFVTRLSYWQLMEEWPRVLDAILRAIAMLS